MKKFNEFGSVNDRVRSGRSELDKETEASVEEVFTQSLRKSQQ